jgi:hypothetical protein
LTMPSSSTRRETGNNVTTSPIRSSSSNGVGLGDLEKRLSNELLGGMQQRVPRDFGRQTVFHDVPLHSIRHYDQNLAHAQRLIQRRVKL